MDGADVVSEYYRAIDEADYDALEALLAAGFVHDRPDRTIEGRASFVEFMRSRRPVSDTDHVVEAVYATTPGDPNADSTGDRYAAEGRLVAPDGSRLFGFVDVFRLEGGAIRRLRTYTDRPPA